MTKQITDKDLEDIDGGMDPISDLDRNPPADVNPKDSPPTGTSSGSGGGSGTHDEIQQNTGGPASDV